MSIRKRERAERLDGDDLAAFLWLCQSDLPAAKVVARMWDDRRVTLTIDRVYKARSRRTYQPKEDRSVAAQHYKPRSMPDDGRCVQCKTAKATHPGVPVGLKGRVCLPCQKAVIEAHAEERWALAQQRRAGA